MDKDKPLKAVGLMSGGLDSTLAAGLLRAQGVEVIGLNFSTGFCVTDHHRAIGRKDDDRNLRNEALRAGADAGVEVRIIDVADEYIEMVKRPRHGYGHGANPCIDCRIFMLNKAREVADAEGAEVIFTGEVLGQRPMSQHRPALDLIERETGLKGRLLRPLSARRLAPTRAEQEGRLSRDGLLDIKGRSRREQVRLAADLEIDDFPQPSGGCCFLADRNFGQRFHDLVREEDAGGRHVGRDEIMMLKVGRHFRLSPTVKVIVGRNEGENAFLDRYRPGRWRFAAMDVMGPVALAQGDLDETMLQTAASITARYCDTAGPGPSRVGAERYAAGGDLTAPPEETRILEPVAAPEALLVSLRVGG